MSKRSFPIEIKLEVIQAYKDGKYSMKEINSRYKVSDESVRNWVDVFYRYGIEGLNESSGWKEYTKELKLDAIQDYLSGEYSLIDIIRRYKISSTSTLRGWIKKYNCHRELKATAKGMAYSMTKGRTTNFDERINIVTYCLSNDKDYRSAAEKYNVSYQQVYQWVKKYEEDGVEALKDKRGRKKTEVELSPEDKIKLEMKKLERENQRLRAENEFLKKLEEIERRRR